MTLAPAVLSELQSSVLAWYAGNGRPLAFRATRDPWSILVSEVMAQQTKAERAAVAWSGFIARYPTPAALAAASPAEVMRAWRGLGYNRREIALRDAAVRIVLDHGGVVPASLEALVALPGIGPYTARAVLAFAFDEPVAPLDTNIRRVLDRALGPLPSPSRALQAAADGFVPVDASAAWSNALMDLGATICGPRVPRCTDCPLRTWCRTARGDGVATPARRTGPKTPAFPSTTRWLRGRILDRLRDASDGTWVTFESPIGAHPVDAVIRELARLAKEGMLESRGKSARLVTSR